MNATNDDTTNGETTGAASFLDELRALLARVDTMAREAERDDDPFFVSRVFDLFVWGDDATVAVK